MTEKDLNQYKAIKQEIDDLNRRIKETKEGPVMSFGTVKGSSKYFPYTEQNFHVTGMDPADTDIRQKQITELLRKREVQRDELIKKQIEIESYIANINDSNTRTIFRMYFIDGLTQNQVARKVNFDRSVISRKIQGYISLHTKHKNK